MYSIKQLSNYGEELEKLLLLRTAPIAVKMLEKEADIPQEAVRPKRDRGYHLAQCQAFAMTRRNRETIAMLKEDNWCWAPLIGYGLVKPLDEKTISPNIYIVANIEAAKKIADHFPRFRHGKYIGILSAPLSTSSFKPDLVLIYSNTAQLRSMFLSIKFKEGHLVQSEFDPIDSCVYSIVPAMKANEYRVTLPDPGEYERAMADENEIILSVPPNKLGELVDGLQFFENRKMGYRHFSRQMTPDFPQPAFYKDLFRMWGLDCPPDISNYTWTALFNK
jgi:uncharacterized protein (DUF169 family)